MISSINLANLSPISTVSNLSPISKPYITEFPQEETTKNTSFETLFQSAMSMINETDELTNNAEEEEIKFALGLSDNVHDLQEAQQKASLSLQYTVAVKNTVLDAYKEIINLQF